MNQQMKQGLGGPTPIPLPIKGTVNDPKSVDPHTPIKGTVSQDSDTKVPIKNVGGPAR